MTETIRFDVRIHQERISRADGTIGLAGWSDEIKKQCITVVKLGPWEKALFVLPNDLARPECNVRDATLTVHLQHHDDDGGWRDLTTQAFTWRPDRGWSNADTPTLGAYLFATMGYKARYPNEVNDDRLRFLVEARITAGGQAVTAKKELALFNGQSSLADVEDLFDLVGFDPRGLQWALDAQHGGVDKVDVSVVADDKAYTASLSPVDGDKGARRPGPIAFLVPRGARVTATVTAETTDGKTLAWQKSGDDLRKVATNPRSITLRTSDFAPQSR
jgi:hypothetical protein